ncbi:hypothetical protein [Streptomyces sp. SAI-149]|jgi:hypothetical protein|uniref:hypothetical protein n=1 Tax=unclassified Streptomyces TaxID=2593676 RepID=UPI000F4DA108|nr:hypothetical protein [Streptomyces sp. SAI-149]MDH6502452.1 hypothetical protein [Streptomyces sp. SAI-149]
MPTRSLRNGLLAALAAVGLLTGATQAASAQSTSGTTAVAPQSASLVYMTTIRTQWTHWTPDWHDESHAGTLYAGTSYFFCYTYGLTYSDLGRQSSVWLKTDDDLGNRNVYVSDVYLNDEGYRNDILWLPKCT